MTDDRGAREIGPVTYNVNKILDTHTHLTGQESAEEIPECMDFSHTVEVGLGIEILVPLP
jgi:hypothetical protein